jgi:hypothetical protein
MRDYMIAFVRAAISSVIGMGMAGMALPIPGRLDQPEIHGFRTDFRCCSATSIRRPLFNMLDAGSGSELPVGSVSCPEPQNESRKIISPWVPVSMVSNKLGVNLNCESKSETSL